MVQYLGKDLRDAPMLWICWVSNARFDDGLLASEEQMIDSLEVKRLEPANSIGDLGD